MSGKLNKYRQRPVEREPEPKTEAWKPRTLQPFAAGDLCNTVYRPLHFSISSPIKILSIRADKRFMSGWAVHVDTSTGIRELCSSHFSKAR